MKKFFGILAAVMVAVLSVFNLSGNYKNAAEPQYFLENTKIKEAFNYNDNSITFYLDNNLNFTTESYDVEDIITFTRNDKVMITYYYVNGTSDTNNLSTILDHEIPSENYGISLYTNENQCHFQVLTANADSINIVQRDPNTKWYENIVVSNTNNEINGFKLENVSIQTNNLQANTEIINTIIGNLTSLPSEEPNEPTVPLTQIGSIITDTIGWFTNIFTGLSAAFYIDGALTTWGTVLFIGVAITLIAMCLKWLISLIKGV